MMLSAPNLRVIHCDARPGSSSDCANRSAAGRTDDQARTRRVGTLRRRRTADRRVRDQPSRGRERPVRRRRGRNQDRACHARGAPRNRREQAARGRHRVLQGRARRLRSRGRDAHDRTGRCPVKVLGNRGQHHRRPARRPAHPSITGLFFGIAGTGTADERSLISAIEGQPSSAFAWPPLVSGRVPLPLPAHLDDGVLYASIWPDPLKKPPWSKPV